MRKEKMLFCLLIFLTSFCAVTANAKTHTVKKGDCLTKISKSYNTTIEAIKEANPDLITNVDKIKTGWELNIPEQKNEVEEKTQKEEQKSPLKNENEVKDKNEKSEEETNKPEDQTGTKLSHEQWMNQLGLDVSSQDQEKNTEINLGASFRTTIAHDIKKNDAIEDVASWQSEATATLEYRPEKHQGRQRFKAKLKAQYHTSDLNQGHEESNIDVEELYYYQAFQSVSFLDIIDFKIGKYNLALGPIIGVRTAMDTVNPRDQKFFNPDDDEQKMSSWLTEINIKKRSITTKAFYKPFFDKDEFEYFGTDWALFGHLKENLKGQNLPTGLKTFIDQIDVHETKGGSEWGIDLKTEQLYYTLGLNYFHGYSDTPAITSFPIKNMQINNLTALNSSVLLNANLTSNTIETEYYDFDQAGLYFSGVVADNEIRSEITYCDKEAFLNNNLTSSFSPTLSIVLEGSRDTSYGRLTTQIFDKIILNYDENILFENKHNFQLGLEWRKDAVFNDYLDFYCKALLEEKGTYVGPGTEFKIGEFFAWQGPLKTAKVKGRIDYFRGEKNSKMDMIENNSQAVLQFLFNF